MLRLGCALSGVGRRRRRRITAAQGRRICGCCRPPGPSGPNCADLKSLAAADALCRAWIGTAILLPKVAGAGGCGAFVWSSTALLEQLPLLRWHGAPGRRCWLIMRSSA